MFSMRKYGKHWQLAASHRPRGPVHALRIGRGVERMKALGVNPRMKLADRPANAPLARWIEKRYEWFTVKRNWRRNGIVED